MTATLDRVTPAKLAEWNRSRFSPAGWQPSWGPAPRWGTARSPERETLGGLAGEVSAELGKPFFPHQQYVVDVTLELDAGAWVYGLAVWYMQRRAGKTVGIAPVSAVTSTFELPLQVWLTAQKRESAVARWREATDPLMESDLAPQLKRWVSNSHESLRWPNGSTFRPFAPDEDTMHGEDPDIVFRDEDWSFTLEQAALVEAGYSHAFSVKTGLDIRMSAAGTARSTSMKKTRALGRRSVESGKRSGMAYFEWCVPEEGPDGRPVIDLPDDMLLELILMNHPRRGRGLREDFVAQQLDKDRRDALRAYGGIDNDESLDDWAAIAVPAMNAARAEKPIPPTARVALAVEVDPDSLEGSIVASWVWPEGVVQVEAIERRPGVRWLRDTVDTIVTKQDVGAVAVVQAGPSRGVADELAQVLDEGLLLRVPAEDYAAACKRFRDTITEQHKTAEEKPLELLLHDPAGSLWAANRAAEEKPLRSGLVWRPRSPDVPVSMLGAFALGTWVAARVPAPDEPDSFWVY